MSRINTNVQSMIARRVLGQQNQSLNTSLERLSTGFQINRGSDDPAGLIASENLRSEQRAISAAVGNAERAEQVVNVAEGGLQEISNLLLEVQSLIGQSANDAGISDEEKEANQLQIDSILQTIDRIAGATSFNGTKLLNGTFDYTYEGGSLTSGVTDLSIQSARLSDAAGATIDVTVDVEESAQTAVVALSLGTTFDNGGNGSLTVEITGLDGVQQFTFASGSAIADIATAINTYTEAIGVSATVSGGYVLVDSQEFGSDAFVRAKVLEDGDQNLNWVATISSDASIIGNTTDGKDFGRDATVVINGNEAITDGLTARVATDGFDVTVSLDGTNAVNTTGGSVQFTVTGGGADFNLAPSVSLASKVSLGIGTMTTGNLGNSSDGFLSDLKAGGTNNVVNGDLTGAQKIVDAAIGEVSSLRGRLGAFTKNVVASTIANLGVALENTAAAESVIRDTDFALETAELTRKQIMGQAASQSLGIANSQPQQVLALLG